MIIIWHSGITIVSLCHLDFWSVTEHDPGWFFFPQITHEIVLQLTKQRPHWAWNWPLLCPPPAARQKNTQEEAEKDKEQTTRPLITAAWSLSPYPRSFESAHLKNKQTNQPTYFFFFGIIDKIQTTVCIPKKQLALMVICSPEADIRSHTAFPDVSLSTFIRKYTWRISGSPQVSLVI